MDAPDSERISLRTNVAFGAQGVFGAAMALVVAVFLSKFYVDVVLMPAGILAVAIAVGRAFDAITDPIMGHITDHTRSRWGRRKPWIFVGVLGNAVAYYMMLTPPEALGSESVTVWYTTVFVLGFLFVTMSHVPRQALSVEITLDALQRQKLYGMAAGFVALGTILGAIMPTLLQGKGITNPREQMQVTAAIYVTGYVLLNMVFLWLVQERKEFVGRGEVPFVPGTRRALRNKPFRIMFVSHVITAVPFAIPAVLMPFFVQYVLRLDVLKWTGIYVLTYLASGFVCLPIWTWLARRYGKLAVWLIVSFIGVTGGAALFFVGPGDTTLVLAIEAYVGMQSAVWLFIGGSMHADVVDYDELHTGKRREAQFSALWSIIPKFALIPGAAIPLALLGAAGYVPNEPEQPAQALLTLRVLFALVPAAFNAVGLSIMWWYPLSERKHAQIREGVARHAAGEDALDPLTGKLLPPPGRRSVDEATGWFLDYFSARELRMLVRSGARAVVTSVLVWSLIFAAVMSLCTHYAITHITSFDENPGPLPALAIVIAGLGLSGFVFHLLRLPAARQLAQRTPSREVIESHLASLLVLLAFAV